MSFSSAPANVGVVIVRTNQNIPNQPQLLLVKNKAKWKEINGKKFFKPSKWGLPNGKREPGESVVKAAVREVEEETGYRVWLDREVSVAEKAGDHLNITFLGQIVGERKKTMDEGILACEWFSLGQLPDMYRSHQRRIISLLKKRDRVRATKTDS